MQFATASGGIGSYADYVAKFDDALARLTPTNENVEVRVCALGISLDASHITGDCERAERCLPRMRAIADEERDTDSAARLHGLILTWEIQLARARNDAARMTAKFQEALSLLDRLERKGSSARALGGFRHNLAHHLNQSGRSNLALPVLDAKLAAGGGSHGDNGYAWLMHAAAVWKVTRDRPRTLALLREARDHDPRDLTNEFGRPRLQTCKTIPNSCRRFRGRAEVISRPGKKAVRPSGLLRRCYPDVTRACASGVPI